MVKAGSSPDDPALAEYWTSRRRRAAPPPLDGTRLSLLQRQQGACPACGELLLYADYPPQSPQEWEQWVRTTSKALSKRVVALSRRGSSDTSSTLQLVHTRCLTKQAAREVVGA